MKGKKRFTKNEIERIKSLTRMKISASRSEQKQIRDRIRRIGFYYSDFSNSKGYDEYDIDVLIRNSEIEIIDNNESVTTTDTQDSEANQNFAKKSNQKSNSKKPLIVNAPSDLSAPIFGLEPLIDEKVKYLILGTFPARESIEKNFYYQNQVKRFWGQALRGIGELENKTNSERKEILLKSNIGLWDIFECVQREGGNQDNAIEKAKYNDLENLLAQCPSINYIIFNGKNAMLWLKEDHPEIISYPKLKYKRLQSTSGSNGWFNEGKDWNEFFNSVLV